MKITRGLAQHTPARHPVLTIGNFDGQHLGHRALLRAVVERARAVGGTPMVLTLDPHPVKVLAPQADFRLLSTMEEKLQCFEEAGIEEVVILEFNKELAALSPEDFVLRIITGRMQIRDVFVGEHFAFGKDRKGRITDLVRMGSDAGFEVHPFLPVLIDGQVVSSSRVRHLLQNGNVRTAARYLGRPYALSGTVVAGETRGRKLGWPTANIRLSDDRVIPEDGVYATTTVWEQQSLDSVSYVGTRPTFGSGERLLEVYLLDQRVDLYGQHVRVQFVDHLRGDMEFESAEALSARINLDVSLARETLRTASHGAPET